MNKFFYTKLALTNIKKNSKTYFPYVLTCICTVMMFYIMHAISINNALNSQSLKVILSLGTIVIGVFSTIFLFYTNSFLIKRRKKEIGLYNILGLGKKHIAKVLILENLFISAVSLVLGLAGGIVLNKLMFMLLLKLLGFKVKFGFIIPIPSLIITSMLFAGIFTATLLFNLFHISISKPIELLKGGQVGEKEPKTKWIMTIIGIGLLSTAYFIALTVKSPLAALNNFFIAVILVIAGTYLIFIAGSITFLKLLRKNKKFYYKTKNFTAVSGMIYRMKQNAAGLANICILSTFVLVMLSTTVSLYVGMEDALKNWYPRDIQINVHGISEAQKQKIEEIVKTETDLKKISIKNEMNFSYSMLLCTKKDDKFKLARKINGNSEISMFNAVSLADYNRLEGKNVQLNADEVLIFSVLGSYGRNTVKLEDKEFKVKEELNSIAITKKNSEVTDTYILVMKDIGIISEISEAVNSSEKVIPYYTFRFDLDTNNSEKIAFTNDLRQNLSKSNITASVDSMANSREEFLSVYGGLFFLGIFLGTLFLMATVLIIYYKQISEGYDDKERFEIMQKVGMSKAEIRSTIKRQILMVFFLPIITALIHIAFAFPIITKLLAVFNLVNIPLFLTATAVTVLVFAAIYGIVFSLTARAYYKIVE